MENNLSIHSLLNTLTGIINNFPEDDSKVIIAKYLLENIDNLHDLNIYDVAEQCYVTRASIRRFCQYIGCDNFLYLKSSPEQHDLLVQNPGDYHNWPADMFDLMQNCNEFFKEHGQTILDKVFNCEQRVILTLDMYSNTASEFQKKMVRCGKMVRIVSNHFEDNLVLKNLKEEDVLFAISITGGCSEKFHSILERIQCQKFLITALNQLENSDDYSIIVRIGDESLLNSNRLYQLFIVEYYFEIIFSLYLNNK